MTELLMQNGETYKVTNLEVTQLQEAYPGVNVELQLKRMQIWLNANPQKRPRKYMRKFIQSWLNRNRPKGVWHPSFEAFKPEERDPSNYSDEAKEREIARAKRLLGMRQ